MHLSKNKFTYTKVFLWVNFTTRTIGEKAGLSMDVKISDQIVITFPSNGKQEITPEETLKRLETISPGITEWSKSFK